MESIITFSIRQERAMTQLNAVSPAVTPINQVTEYPIYKIDVLRVCISVWYAKMDLIVHNVQHRGLLMLILFVLVLIIHFMMIRFRGNVKAVLILIIVWHVREKGYVRLVIRILILHLIMC